MAAPRKASQPRSAAGSSSAPGKRCWQSSRAETPFTLAGAKELQRLGILALAIPLGSSLLGSIAEGLAAGFLNTETATAMDLYFDNEASLMLGLMFLLGSLLCRYGAEQKEA